MNNVQSFYPPFYGVNYSTTLGACEQLNTTMSACEQLGRRCRMIEIAPEYCAVILERMAGMGLEAEKVNP